MKPSAKPQEHFKKICGHVQRMYVERGEVIIEQEILVAAPETGLGFVKSWWKLSGRKYMSNKKSYEELEKAARALCYSITDSSFEYPNSKDKLFIASTEMWPLNAWIDKFNGINAYSAGYLDAAKLLARIVIYSRRKMDTLVYPIIYLYRHYLEIKLKDLIRKGASITDTVIDDKIEKILGDHNLMHLWNKFKPFFEEISGNNDAFADIKKGMESYINQIHSIDPASFTFRYDRRKNSKAHNLENVKYINLFYFCQNMEKLTNIIEGIDYEFEAALDYVNEMRRAYCDY